MSEKKPNTKTSRARKPTGSARKKAPVKTSAPAADEPRVLPGHKRFWYKPWTWPSRLPAPPRKPLPKARTLTVLAAKRLWGNKKLFGGLVLIYGIVDILLVRGLSSAVDLGGFKSALDMLASGVWEKAYNVGTSFIYLLTTSGATTGSGQYTSILLLIMSLAFIWAMRQVQAGNRPRIRDAFYEGMYPLIPFLLVLFVVSLQLIPLAIGAYLYNVVVSHGIASDIGEKAIWLAVFIVLAIWSFYMVTSTLFALYIVTLPEMTPMKALRSARQLVYKRRLLIWRKLIYLPIVLLIVAAVIEIPLIYIWAGAAEWAFFALSMASLAAVHGYLYTLYREML